MRSRVASALVSGARGNAIRLQRGCLAGVRIQRA